MIAKSRYVKSKDSQRLWQAKNRERVAEASRKRYWTDPERYRLRNREYRKRYMEKVRSAGRKHFRYPEATRPMPSVCECCGKPQIKKSLGLDHCHETGIFRGWLCFKCNHGIGLLGDSPGGLSLAIAYLTRAYGNRR